MKIDNFKTIYDLIHVPNIPISDIHRIRSFISVKKTHQKNEIMNNYKVYEMCKRNREKKIKICKKYGLKP